MEVNPATTSTLKRSAFHIREFPRFTVGHFLVVKLTTVRRWRGKPPQKNHITGTPSQKKMWPPQKKISWKWWSYIPEWRKPGKPRCERFFGFSGFLMGFFSGRWGLFLELQEAAKNDVVGWRFVKGFNDVFHDFRPNFEENAAFLKGWGIKSLSKNADTLYNQMMTVVRLKGGKRWFQG